MKTITVPSQELPVVGEVDVLVAGGGPAGIAAATTAARTGASVMRGQRYGYLGGLATGGLVLFMDRTFDKDGRRCISVDDGLIGPIRVIPPCMMTGQAAGMAAALSVQEGVAPRELDAEGLRGALAAAGVILP